MPTGADQTAILKQILDEFPSHSLRILEKAVKKGKEGVIRALLDLSVRPEPGGDRQERDNEFAPLHSASYEGRLDCVKVLVDQGQVSVNAQDYSGSTPLINAARGKHYDIVKWLLVHGANPTFKPDSGFGVSEAAAVAGNPHILDLLLQSGGISISCPCILECGVESGNREMVKFILQRGGYPTEGDTEKSGRLTSEQRQAIENSLWRATRLGSLETLYELLGYLTRRNENGDFLYFELKDPSNRIEIFNSTEDAIERPSRSFRTRVGRHIESVYIGS